MHTDSIPLKRCGSCKEYFPPTTEYFHVRKASKDGLSASCKTCANAARARRAKEHPEIRQTYKERNRDRIRRVDREWYAANPDQQEKKKATSRKTYWKDVEVSRAKSREYGRAHSKEAVERNKQWAKDNPERYKAIMSNRYALEKNAEGIYTAEDLNRIYEELEGRCAYCGMSIYWHIKRDVHIDHIIPLSKGGTNWPDNITLACLNCNSSKSDLSLEDWIATRGW